MGEQQPVEIWSIEEGKDGLLLVSNEDSSYDLADEDSLHDIAYILTDLSARCGEAHDRISTLEAENAALRARWAGTAKVRLAWIWEQMHNREKSWAASVNYSGAESRRTIEDAFFQAYDKAQAENAALRAERDDWKYKHDSIGESWAQLTCFYNYDEGTLTYEVLIGRIAALEEALRMIEHQGVNHLATVETLAAIARAVLLPTASDEGKERKLPFGLRPGDPIPQITTTAFLEDDDEGKDG